MTTPALSVVVNFYDMQREAPRTLHTLSAAYQRDVDQGSYEVIAIDNGSREPLSESLVRSFGTNFRLVRRDARSRSPAAGINAAANNSRGDLVMVCIDGARMLSPGIVSLTLAAFRAFSNPVVATLAWHLGEKLQNLSLLDGYNQQVEDRLLDSIEWRDNGYELFRIACLAGSSQGGWFRPIMESNCVAVRREEWQRVGGLDERFQAAGGGLVALDFYKRVCESLGQLILLLGEGTFHQFHGGVATNVAGGQHPWEQFQAEYARLRGCAYSPPQTLAHYLGRVPAQCLPHLSVSVERAAGALKRPAKALE